MTAFMAVGKTQNLEMENTWKTQALVVMMAVTAVAGTAQVTYNHDSSKKNQVTVMEVGKGALTPDAYYWLLHNDYRQSASSRNKLSYRTLAAGNLYKQVDDAELIDSSLTKRAEIKALNVADRQIDLAWAAESDKINGKLADFEQNISRIASANDRSYWEERCDIIKCAIRSVKSAYLSNAQRKQQYLRIYDELCEINNTLIKYLATQANYAQVRTLLHSEEYDTADNATIASGAIGKWHQRAKSPN